MDSDHNNIIELHQNASVFWPPDFSKETFEQNILPLLIETQDTFVSILGVPMLSITTLFDILNLTTFPSNLVVLHLIVLTDLSGRTLQKAYQSCDVLFPAGTMEYMWGADRRVYRFKALPAGGAARPVLLSTSGNALVKKVKVSDLAQDVIALLLFGGTCPDERVSTILEKCVLGRYLGDPIRTREFVRWQTLNLHRFDIFSSMFGRSE